MTSFPRPAASANVRLFSALAAASLLALAGCGGGDDTDDGASYTIAGTLSGLGTGKTVVLQLNAGADLSVAANGSFRFAAPVAAGTRYAVTVKTAPAGQVCAVTRGSGTASTNVSDVAVSCGTAPTSGVPALVGDWVMIQCTTLGASSSARTLVRVTQTGTSTFSWGNGAVQYPSANCTGPATAGPVTPIGNVQVTEVKSALGIAAHWAQATLVTGATSRGVWAKRSTTGLCLVGDQNPTLFASAEAVLSAIEVAPDGMCYTPLQQN